VFAGVYAKGGAGVTWRCGDFRWPGGRGKGGGGGVAHIKSRVPSVEFLPIP